MNQFFPLTSIWILSFFTSTVLCHARNQPMLSPPLTPTPSVVITPNGHIEKESVFLVIFVSVSVTLIILWSCCVFIFWRIKGLNSSPGKVQSSDVHLPTLNTFKGALNTSKGALNTSKGRVRTPVLNRFNPLSIRGSIPEVEYKLVEAATDNFSKSSILGKGRIGCVYKASFNFGALAAVKKFDATEPCHESIFENEIELLSNIAHPNIVSLLGYCVHWETRLLIYEFMERGSLEKQLHGPSSGMALTWSIRMKIALDVARGLEYLHEHCNPRMIQRDLNSSTILLDSSYNAKISGFGLAIAGGNENKKRMQRSGSLGYEAPEYLLKGELTEKSDVYALGVVILELLLGRKPIEELAGSKCRSITTWAMPQLTDREKLPNIVDPVIRHTMDLKHLCQVAAVAVLCVQPEPSYRPLITDVVYSLIPLVPMELGGTLRTSDPNL